MSAISSNAASTSGRPFLAIFCGGAVVGFIDITYAILFYGARGVPPLRIPQSIASGLLGVSAYQGGVQTAILGIFLHFVIAFGAATVFFLLSRYFKFLLGNLFMWGPIFGAAIYLFMHFIVLPLAANPRLRTTSFSFVSACDFLVHLLLLGPSIVFFARRFSR